MSGPRYCCVGGCHSNQATPGVKLFRFPARPWEKERREKWIAAVKPRCVFLCVRFRVPTMLQHLSNSDFNNSPGKKEIAFRSDLRDPSLLMQLSEVCLSHFYSIDSKACGARAAKLA